MPHKTETLRNQHFHSRGDENALELCASFLSLFAQITFPDVRVVE